MPPRPSPLPLALSLAIAALAAGADRPADAGVLDDPHVGGIGFGGPTTGDLTAIYWNPAALGLMQGVQVTVGMSAQSTSLSVQRAPIDTATGAPGGGRGFPPVAGSNQRTPASWPPGPGTFAAAGWAVGNRFTLALAFYTPSFQQAAYPPNDDGEQPTRFHAVAIDLRNVAIVPALAFRIGNDFRIGMAPGFLFSTGRLVFDEDTTRMASTAMPLDCDGAPCAAEDARAAARYDVRSGNGLFDSSLAFSVGGGVYYRRGTFEAGLAFSSRPLGNEGGGVGVNATRTQVTPPPRVGAALCPPGQTDRCVSAHLRYDLPDILTAGVTWHVTPRIALTGVLRWLTFARHERFSIRVTGPATGRLRVAALPERIVLYRGFQDVIEGRLRLEREMATWLRLGVAVRADTGAVAPSRLTAAAVAGPTIEPAIMGELRLGNWLRVTAGYAFTVMPTIDTGTSVFDPTRATACANVQHDLSNPDCAFAGTGAARPTAAGKYGLTQHTGTLTATFKF